MRFLSFIEKSLRRGRERSDIPEAHLYRYYRAGTRVFQPWKQDPDIAEVHRALAQNGARTLVSAERLWTIKWAIRQTHGLVGEVWEAGVYQGGTALFLQKLLDRESTEMCLRLFDTFDGLPDTTAGIDKHHKGEFGNTSVAAIKNLLGQSSRASVHKGLVPDSFRGLEGTGIRLAHLDLDLYRSTLDAIAFVYPRLAIGGIVIVDDYGFPSCPGVRKAIDEYFAGASDTPLILPSGQAVIVRNRPGTT